jgi:hypothetical protein
MAGWVQLLVNDCERGIWWEGNPRAYTTGVALAQPPDLSLTLGMTWQRSAHGYFRASAWLVARRSLVRCSPPAGSGFLSVRDPV